MSFVESVFDPTNFQSSACSPAHVKSGEPGAGQEHGIISSESHDDARVINKCSSSYQDPRQPWLAYWQICMNTPERNRPLGNIGIWRRAQNRFRLID